MVGSGALPKRCALVGSVRLGLNGSGIVCAAASLAHIVESAAQVTAHAPSKRARVAKRPRGRARLRQPQCIAPAITRLFFRRDGLGPAKAAGGGLWLTRVKEVWLTRSLR